MNEHLVRFQTTYLNSDRWERVGKGDKEESKLLLGLNDLFSKHWYLCVCGCVCVRARVFTYIKFI